MRGEIYVFKNNTDSAGQLLAATRTTWSVAGRLPVPCPTASCPSWISRQLICGAGKIVHTSKGATHCPQPAADHIWEGVSSATTRSRPIINTRDEPHADAEQYRRLHVIVGDSNMSETTNLLRWGPPTSCCGCSVRGALRDLSLEVPIRAIREISHDPDRPQVGAVDLG